MLDHRSFYSIQPRPIERPAFQVQNRPQERRRHHGFTRILFIDLADAWSRFLEWNS